MLLIALLSPAAWEEDASQTGVCVRVCVREENLWTCISEDGSHRGTDAQMEERVSKSLTNVFS